MAFHNKQREVSSHPPSPCASGDVCGFCMESSEMRPNEMKSKKEKCTKWSTGVVRNQTNLVEKCHFHSVGCGLCHVVLGHFFILHVNKVDFFGIRFGRACSLTDIIEMVRFRCTEPIIPNLFTRKQATPSHINFLCIFGIFSPITSSNSPIYCSLFSDIIHRTADISMVNFPSISYPRSKIMFAQLHCA